jgi:hypothetical protein
LDYERNLEYQRKRFLDVREGKPLYETPVEVHADLWVAETLDKGAQNKNPLYEEKLDREIAKFFRKIAETRLRKARSEALRILRNADRHLRRSALQLSKSVRNQDN